MSEGRWARKRLCPVCRAKVIGGPDSWVAAINVLVDLEPLDSRAEALVQLAGRGTFELRQRGRHFQLQRRDQWMIRRDPRLAWPMRGRGAVTVLAEHRCAEVDR